MRYWVVTMARGMRCMAFRDETADDSCGLDVPPGRPIDDPLAWTCDGDLLVDRAVLEASPLMQELTNGCEWRPVRFLAGADHLVLVPGQVVVGGAAFESYAPIRPRRPARLPDPGFFRLSETCALFLASDRDNVDLSTEALRLGKTSTGFVLDEIWT